MYENAGLLLVVCVAERVEAGERRTRNRRKLMTQVLTRRGGAVSIIWRSVRSAVIAVIFLFLMGYIEIHIRALELGLVLTWDLAPQEVAMPNVAVLHHVLHFIVFGIIACLFLMKRRGLSGSTGFPALAGGVVLVAVSAWYLATVSPGVVAQEQNEMLEQYTWTGVPKSGALSSATLGMAALLLVIAALRFLGQRSHEYGTV